ncbi:hypothetical protein LRP57_02920 [Schaalia sp. lx-260]|nr:hypothetical protein [Schaalia sp. lx-260]
MFFQRVAKKKPVLLVAVSLCAALSLSACGVHLSGSPGALPPLDDLQKARDMSARTEVAAFTRAQAFARKSSECEPCRVALDAFAQSAQARLDAAGGMWDPWQGHIFPDAYQILPVASAPVDVPTFITWLVRSSERDLRMIATGNVSDSEDAYALALIAVGRHAAAQKLADTYGVELDEADSHIVSYLERASHLTSDAVIPPIASWEFVFSEGADSKYSSEPPSDNSPISGLLSQTENLQRLGQSDDTAQDPLRTAIRSWDCVAQASAYAKAVEKVSFDSHAVSEKLFTRIDSLFDKGASDARVYRCAFTDGDFTSAIAALIDADIRLFISASPDFRTYALSFLREDIQTFLPVIPSAFSPLIEPRLIPQSD